MKAKPFFYTTGVLFFIVGSLHLWRLVFQWKMVIGNWTVPMWLSALAFLLLYFLSFTALKLSR